MKHLFSVVVVICVAFTLITAEEDYREVSLDDHNEYRTEYHAPPLALDSKLNDYALKWAKNMARTNNLRHSKGKYGENIFMTSNVTKSDAEVARDATKAWFDEKDDYTFDNLFSSDTGHFTQVVWYGTKLLGVGSARNKKGVFFCASYDPPGNVQGEFLENVLRL